MTLYLMLAFKGSCRVYFDLAPYKTLWQFLTTKPSVMVLNPNTQEHQWGHTTMFLLLYPEASEWRGRFLPSTWRFLHPDELLVKGFEDALPVMCGEEEQASVQLSFLPRELLLMESWTEVQRQSSSIRRRTSRLTSVYLSLPCLPHICFPSLLLMLPRLSVWV